MAYLSDFLVAEPLHETAQATTLAWLASAHAQAAERAGGREGRDAAFERLISRYGCGEDRVGSRGHDLADFGAARLADMPVLGGAEGGMSRRMEAFTGIASRVMELLVPGDAPPAHLLHVTCTGYTAPSAAQELVARRGWGRVTTVTHVYHSGCYAAFPAVRLASGMLRAGEHARIAHTEPCTLHFNPALHDPEQLVVQSLFADGHASYRVTPSAPPGRSLQVLALREEILADSTGSMTWRPEDWGFGMTLARDVPERIVAELPGLLRRLGGDAGLELGPLTDEALFVVHPGGPRILDVVQDAMKLKDGQMAISRDVLRRHGNMSSATIPYAWREVVEGDARAGRMIVSCAFGPGLTASAGLLRVHEETPA